MLFRQGHTYMGGVDVPIIVSDEDIRKGLVEKGFTDIQIMDRDVFPISQLPFQAQADDSWDTVVTGRRVGPDTNIELPSQAKWAIDTTPADVVMPAPGPGSFPSPQPPPGPILAGPTPSGFPSLPEIPQISISSSDYRLPLVVGMGVIGGAAIGWWAIQHMFVEGMTSEERKGMLVLSASFLAVWGINELIGLDKAWWATVEGVSGKAQEELEKP